MNGSHISFTSPVSVCADRPVADRAAVAWYRTQLWLLTIMCNQQVVELDTDKQKCGTVIT